MKKSLLALISFACIVLHGSPARSLVGARQSFAEQAEEQSYTAADYVQDGLVMLYDGIENVGVGVHDRNAGEWIDLVSGNAGKVDVGGTWDLCSRIVGSTYMGHALSIEGRWGGDYHVEVVFEINSWWIGWVDFFSVKLGRYGSIIVPKTDETHRLVETWGSTKKKSNFAIPIGKIVTVSSCPMEFLFWVNGVQGGFTSETPESFSGESDTQKFCSGEGSRLFCVRQYNRILTQEEIEWNLMIDRARFRR